MDLNTLALIALTAVFLFGLFLLGSYEEKEEIAKKETPVYSQEEVSLAEFLEIRQAVNDDFLHAQNQLLKQLFEERRRS